MNLLSISEQSCCSKSNETLAEILKFIYVFSLQTPAPYEILNSLIGYSSNSLEIYKFVLSPISIYSYPLPGDSYPIVIWVIGQSLSLGTQKEVSDKTYSPQDY